MALYDNNVTDNEQYKVAGKKAMMDANTSSAINAAAPEIKAQGFEEGLVRAEQEQYIKAKAMKVKDALNRGMTREQLQGEYGIDPRLVDMAEQSMQDEYNMSVPGGSAYESELIGRY